MKGAENKNLRVFRKLYGDKNMENIVLVTTKWNLVSDQGVAEAREAQLISEFFEPMIKLGAQVARDYGTQESAQAIVRRVLGMPAIDLSVQKQIVGEDRAPKDTDTGKEVEGEQAARQKDLENEIADLKNEQKEDSDPKKHSLYEITKLLKKLSKSIEDAETLKQSQYEEFQTLREQIREKQKQFDEEKILWEWEKERQRLEK